MQQLLRVLHAEKLADLLFFRLAISISSSLLVSLLLSLVLLLQPATKVMCLNQIWHKFHRIKVERLGQLPTLKNLKTPPVERVPAIQTMSILTPDPRPSSWLVISNFLQH